MAHFKFKEGVYFVRGALQGAILDTNTGNVYSINETGVSILTGKVKHEGYLEELTNLSLLEPSDMEKEFPNLPKMDTIRLQFVWFEIITDDCNESCVHCYADSMPPAYRKEHGIEVLSQIPSTKQKLTYLEWEQLISQSYELGCRRCQFIGGEPLLYRDGGKTVLDLAQFAKDLGYEFIEIFTNATLLTAEKIEIIKNLKLNIAVSLYSNDPEVHDKITQTQGSHQKTVINLKLLKAAGVSTRVATVLMKQNEHTAKSTVVFAKDIGVNTRSPDPLRPKGRGENSLIKPSAITAIRYGYKTRPNFTASRKMIAHYSTGHSCLAGKITITDNGDVLPCIFSRNNIVGNVFLAGSLDQVLVQKEIQQIWNTTKDNVMVCKDCEFRYVCFDCRPLSEAAAQGKSDYLHAPYPRCTYNPYTGEWGKGIWKVDDEGKAWYDTSLEPLIQEVILKSGISEVQNEGH